MPFDGTDFRPRRKEPKRASEQERAFTLMFVVLALVMFVIPVSIAELISIMRYFCG